MIARMRFTKLGRIRWTSHRDVARMWERALRRARLPVAYSGGFSPRPQLSFGLALPTGCESVAEYLDVALTTEVDPETVADRVRPLLPEGIGVVGAIEPEPGSDSLQEAVTSCLWEISVPAATRDDVDDAVSRVMAAGSLPVRRERKGRLVTDDLRPSLLAFRTTDEVVYEFLPEGAIPVENDTHGVKLVAELGTRPRGVRPAELAQVMGIELGSSRRTCQWIEREGSKFEPVESRVAAFATAVERVS